MDRQGKTEHKPSHKQIHGYPPMLRTNLRSIGTSIKSVYAVTTCTSRLEGLPSLLYFPTTFSITQLTSHEPSPPSLHTPTAAKVNRHFGLCCVGMVPELPIEGAHPRSERQEC